MKNLEILEKVALCAPTKQESKCASILKCSTRLIMAYPLKAPKSIGNGFTFTYTAYQLGINSEIRRLLPDDVRDNFDNAVHMALNILIQMDKEEQKGSLMNSLISEIINNAEYGDI